jgi:carotenoid 1,2-hydratase
MTERAARHVQRSAHEFRIGPSLLQWDGEGLRVDIDEVAIPLPRRVLGQVRLFPQALSPQVMALDDFGRHRWGPVAPVARVEVALHSPALRWSGHAYMDSNEGDEPLAEAFDSWDWMRAPLADGGAAVVYDARQRLGREDHAFGLRFKAGGGCESFEPPPRRPLPASAWRVQRQARCEAAPGAITTLEDTPFYARSLLAARLLGQPVQAMHESLDLRRFVHPVVQAMLPWRMPRRR